MRSLLKTIAVKEIRRVYPRIDTAKNKKALLALFCGLLAPVILYRRYVQFALPYVEMVVTTRCTLRCVGCSNLMPCYDPGMAHSDMDIVKQSIDGLLSVSRHIAEMKFIGGEPFMSPRLYEAVGYASQKKQIKQITIITNGTIVPTGENLKCLRRKNITVHISKYPAVNPAPLIKALKQNEIEYHLIAFETWQDYGNMDRRKMDVNTLKKSFEICPSAECKTVMDGRFYACPREAHGRALGLVKGDNAEVALTKTPPKQLRQDIRALYGAMYTPACDYCTPIWQRQEIECAEQLPSTNKGEKI